MIMLAHAGSVMYVQSLMSYLDGKRAAASRVKSLVYFYFLSKNLSFDWDFLCLVYYFQIMMMKHY